MKIEIRKIAISSFLGAAFYMIIGWVVFEYFLGSYMELNTLNVDGFRKTEKEASLLMLFISCFAYSTLLSIIYGVWAGITHFKTGVKAGALIGVLVAIMANTYWYSTSHYFSTIYPLLVDVLAAGLTVGLTGGVIAWWLGRK